MGLANRSGVLKPRELLMIHRIIERLRTVFFLYFLSPIDFYTSKLCASSVKNNNNNKVTIHFVLKIRVLRREL